jgi:hypothetical protein
MCAAIREFGFRIPVVALSDGTVVDGHLRLKAAIRLGFGEREIEVVDARCRGDHRMRAVAEMRTLLLGGFWRMSGTRTSDSLQLNAGLIDSKRSPTSGALETKVWQAVATARRIQGRSPNNEFHWRDA